MLVARCGQRICRSMKPRRLLILAASLSITATITFFIYSMTLDNQSHSSARAIQYVKLQSRFHGVPTARPPPSAHRSSPGKARKAVAGSHGNRGHGNAVPRGDTRKGAVEKMSWPDKKKSDKGRQHAKRKSSRLDNLSGLTNPLSVPRMAEYCNLPIREFHGKEGEAPAGFSLKSVYVVIRHGDRSPMMNFRNHPGPTLSCQYNASAHPFDIPNYGKYVSHLQYYVSRLHKDNAFSYPLYPNSAVCDVAQMTGNGASQHLLNGRHLHERYVQKWRLFSEPFSPDQVYAKSTGYTRTYQSAIAFLFTFLPKLNLTDLNIFRSDNLFFCSEKSLGRTCSCPTLKLLKKASDDEAGMFNRNNSDMIRVRKQIAKVFNLKTQQLPWIWGMVDSLMAYVCHKIPLPCSKDNQCVQPSHLAELWHQLDLHGAKLEQLQPYQKFAHLGIHPLLHEISQHMILTTKKKAKVKFVLYSGHDTTLASLTTVLGIGHGRWPKYASRVVMELYARDEPKKHHFLRILLNGEDVTSKVVFCKSQAKNGFCKLKYFIDFIQKDNLKLFNGKTYAQACSII